MLGPRNQYLGNPIKNCSHSYSVEFWSTESEQRITRAKTQRAPRTKNSKHEIRNSKQFQMLKICKNVKQASFGFGVLDFSRFEIDLSLSLFRIWIFGFRILFRWRFDVINSVELFLLNV